MKNKKILSILLVVLSVAMLAAGCGEKTSAPVNDVPSDVVAEDSEGSSSEESESTEAVSEETTEATEGSENADVTVLGEGNTVFTFVVTDKDGNETNFEIHTDAKTVGEALLALGLIEGEEGAYGLYVKVVNGITADYDVDGTYWAFYVDGEYATSGVDMTDIVEGSVYSFKVE